MLITVTPFCYHLKAKIMRYVLFYIVSFFCFTLFGQVVVTNPAFPSDGAPVTITFDATQGTGGLEGYGGDVYVHTGVLTNLSTGPSNWRYVKTDWGENTEATRMTRVNGESNLYQITLGPSVRDYYGVPGSETITKLAMVFRSAAQVNGGYLEGKANGGNDIFVEMATGEFQFFMNAPGSSSFLVDTDDVITIQAQSSSPATFTLTVNDVEVEEATVSGVTAFDFDYTVTQTSGTYEVVLSATDGESTEDASFTYSMRSVTVNEPRPAGIKRGINYDTEDNTRVTLCLQAPNKSSVYVIGDFNDWGFSSDYLMKKDGEYFWLEIDGLEPNVEYAFQYVVDESIYIADPYCDKILQPLDQYISEDIYPNLKEFPSKAVNAVGYYNTVSVLETGQTPYVWQNANFEKPPKSQSVIYKLLIRDFFGDGQETYVNLRDTLSYIKSLGVNVIELLPVTEFAGNNSWGYNPTFMFAPDKAYGTKIELKAFIDAAHGLGIAVNLDMVLNHQEQPSPLVLLDFNVATGQVTPQNPYFNVTPTHPFNVFYDMNHSSTYTQSFVDSVNYYWINEYHFDGYRFDLSKGFTQTNYGGDVNAWSNYDAGRVALLKRMADAIWSHTPDAYVILEHFATNSEETELANYGMMLWGNMYGPYKENILGTASPDIRWTYSGARGWNDMNVIGFMESHDEERQMFEALNYGGSSGTYNVRNVNTALDRIKLASAFLYSIPGPKMLFQFGELGYDLSINRCPDGTISNDCRTAVKPNPWDISEGYPYYTSTNRTKLRKTVSELLKLKVEHDVFTSGNYSIIESTIDPKKQITLANPSNIVSPSSAEEMSVVIVGNFGLTARQTSITFPFSGATWYSYFDQGKVLTFSGSTTTLTLQPGEFRLYTNYALPNPEPELMENLTPLAPTGLIVLENTAGVSLNWTNNSSINDGNNVYRRVGTGEWVNIANLASATVTYLDANVQEGVTYDYRIGTYTNVGETFSNEVEILVEEFVLGLSDELAAAIFPNPTKERISVKMADQEPLYYFLYDLNGRETIRGKFNDGNTTIDLATQSKGLYLLEVITRSGERHFSKVIKE